MNSDLQQQIFSRLDAIGAKLSVGAQAIWKMYLAQARLDGIEYLIFFLLTTAAAFYAAKRSRTEFARPLTPGTKVVSDEYSNLEMKPVDNHVPGWLFLAATAVFLIPACICGVQALDHLVNPQFVAFQTIISSLRNQ